MSDGLHCHYCGKGRCVCSERFETLGDLYYRKTGYLRPGKSEPMETGRDSSSNENRQRFQEFMTGSALNCALDKIAALEAAAMDRDAKIEETATDHLLHGEHCAACKDLCKRIRLLEAAALRADQK